MKTDITLGLHLTVDKNGQISLWDKRTEADGETALCLPISHEQRLLIEKARLNAEAKALTRTP